MTYGLVDETDSREDIIGIIRRSGLDSVADRLVYLDELADDDPEEELIGLESLRLSAKFMLGRHLPAPKIGTSPGGLVHAVWWVNDGILSMDFLPTGVVRFAGFLEDREWNARGVLPPDRIMAEIEPFRKMLCG